MRRRPGEFGWRPNGHLFSRRRFKPRLYQVVIALTLVGGLVGGLVFAGVADENPLAGLRRSLRGGSSHTPKAGPDQQEGAGQPPAAVAAQPAVTPVRAITISSFTENPGGAGSGSPGFVEEPSPPEPEPVEPIIIDEPEPPENTPVEPEPPAPPPVIPEPEPVPEPPPPEPEPVPEPPLPEPEPSPTAFVIQPEECAKGLDKRFIDVASRGDDQGPFLETITVLDRYELGKTREMHMHRCIRDTIAALLNEYNAGQNDQADRLGGWGWRSNQRQIELRRLNCGPTRYDIYSKPPSECSPPTAFPGTSIHQDGLAIDFYCQRHGAIQTPSECNGALQWLNCNGARFGLINLPSEKWHWYYPLNRLELLESKLEETC